MTMLAAAAALMVPTVSSARGCEFDGSMPGTVPKAYPVSAGGQTIYVDDRDYADADEDGVAGGIWLYYESNRVAGLQRGGDQIVLGRIPGTVPYVPPTVVGVPGAPNVTLFPSGLGGGSVSSAAGAYDECVESATPDTVVGWIPPVEGYVI